MTEPIHKYGVDVDPRAAAPGSKCPRCNAPIVMLDPPRCRMCGTEPFEAHDDVGAPNARSGTGEVL